MNREIKFRAWHKGYPSHRKLRAIEPKMLYDERVGDCIKFYADGQPVELMQYTGLKDKNGKEIYESDFMGDGVIKWILEEGCFKLVSYKWEHNLRYAANNYEINGNIYEGKNR